MLGTSQQSTSIMAEENMFHIEGNLEKCASFKTSIPFLVM
jgi:hypothetical protein